MVPAARLIVMVVVMVGLGFKLLQRVDVVTPGSVTWVSSRIAIECFVASVVPEVNHSQSARGCVVGKVTPGMVVVRVVVVLQRPVV